MSRSFLTVATLAGLLALAVTGRTLGYGAAHASATYVAPNGSVQHSGGTVGYGPGGAYSTSHTTYGTPYGGYGGTASVTNAAGTTTVGTGGYRAYTPTAYSSYSPGGTCPTYTGSVYRAP
jgi:hypothetical protein